MNSRDVYIGLGSNQGNSIKLIEKAIELVVERIGDGWLIAKSSMYETKPVGFEADQQFVNAVMIVPSKLPAEEIMDALLMIEKELGRVRSGQEGYESRSIDLDILAIEEEIINSEKVVIPHPRMHERGFVLLPFLEIDSEWVHPVEKQSITVLVEQLIDREDVRRILA